MKPETVSSKKILENPFVGSLVVPIAIVLVGALIIFGITKMLSTERTYRDLVDEIQSKSFGNKWVAAYELTKVINSGQIPKEDFPWVINNLSDAYRHSIDGRSRRFIISALGSIKSDLSLNVLDQALSDSDPDVVFQAIVSLASLPQNLKYDWTKVINFLSGSDALIKQVAILALATHHVPEAHGAIKLLLASENRLVKYAAATALIGFHDESANTAIQEALLLPYTSSSAAGERRQVIELKLSALDVLVKNHWTALNDTIIKMEKDEEKLIVEKSREALNLLKK